MKARTFTTAAAIILLSLMSWANLNAKTESLVYDNHYNTISTTTFEKMFVHSTTLAPNKRYTYLKDEDNKLHCKQSYNWDAKQGWIPSQKYEYQYSETGKLKQLEYAEWNKTKGEWKVQSIVMY